MVFDPAAAPRGRDAFLAWFEAQTDWADDRTYDDPANTTADLAGWYAEMNRDFPDMNGPRQETILNSPYNARATGYTIGETLIYVDFRWSEAEAADAAVRALAVKHGVGYFNPSASNGEIWFPPTDRWPDKTPIPGLSLRLEARQAFDQPSLALIEASVDWLRTDGGPGFLILERDAGDNYAQVGGGNGQYTLEWRETSGGVFRHWVAGHPNVRRGADIKIPGNGSHFTVKGNERLTDSDVKALLTAFAFGDARPPQYAWRDITVELGGVGRNDPKPWWKFWG